MSVVVACHSYFRGFQELVSPNTSKVVASLKIASYIFIVPPICVGITYVVSSLCTPLPDDSAPWTRTAENIRDAHLFTPQLKQDKYACE